MMNFLWMEYTAFPDHEIWTSGMRALPRPSLTEQIIAFKKRDSAAKHLTRTWQQTHTKHRACTCRCFYVHYLHFSIHHVSVHHGWLLQAKLHGWTWRSLIWHHRQLLAWLLLFLFKILLAEDLLSIPLVKAKIFKEKWKKSILHLVHWQSY